MNYLVTVLHKDIKHNRRLEYQSFDLAEKTFYSLVRAYVDELGNFDIELIRLSDMKIIYSLKKEY